MYGLLIENLASFIRVQWGEGKWDSVRKHAGVDAPSFSIHHVYAETLLQRLARSATQILGVDERQFFEAMGVYFVEYVGHYGYDKMLLVLGRHLRDFLNGLDNLHEYLKFSYTKMRAPSFYCDNETATGLRLHYRSKRRGFVWYTIGQIKQVAKHFYEQDIEIELISEELDGETMHNIFQLTFDNQAFVEHESLRSIMRKESQLPIRASIIFELFPFSIVFSTEMVITYTGHALLTILKELVGQCMTEAFEIIRPLIPFSFQTILERRNNIFELVTTSPIKEESLDKIMENEEAEGVHLKLRGQMLFMEEWNMIIFLANPVMPDLESLLAASIYINDLSLHDCSRDLVLAGQQQSVELKLALDQEQQKSKKLEESMKKLDDEMKRTDELLYQMIPKQVADRIRKGENPVATCEVFESVSILFSDVVTFTDICSKISPMQVVSMLNHMYSLFDQLTERNGVYKVETIGDSYMVVSGAPVQCQNHAERVCDMALDMVDASQAIKNPSSDIEGEHLKLRVGCHSGMVVAGVVGVKMPRYCLFGDAVNTASRMESTSEGNRVQISEFCKALLPGTYKTEVRGTVAVKGKGEMQTHWLLGRESRVPLSKVQAGSFDWNEPGTQKRRLSKGNKGSRKSSMIPAPTEATEAAKSRGNMAKIKDTPAPAPPAPQPNAEPVKASKVVIPPKLTPPIIRTPDDPPEPTPQPSPTPAPPTDSPKPSTPEAKPQRVLQTQESIAQDASGNRLELSSAGKDLYRSARRLSDALRPRSPSPSPSVSRSRPTTVKQTSTTEQKPPPTPTTSLEGPPTPSPTSSEKKVTLVRQVTLAEVPDKLAEVMSSSTQKVNIVKMPAVNAPISGDLKNVAKSPSTDEIICIVPATGQTPNGSNVNIPTDANGDRESFLINVKMRKSPEGSVNGKGLKSTISDIAVGISRLPKNEAFRKKLRENKISVVTADMLTDMGCGAFADKQRQVISQACSIL